MKTPESEKLADLFNTRRKGSVVKRSVGKPIKKRNRTYKDTYKGIYVVRNPKKYMGSLAKPIIYRSLWEKELMLNYDLDPNVIGWLSDSINIPYFNPIKNRMANYIPDFICKRKDNGKIIIQMVEVKPIHKAYIPKKNNKQWASYLNLLEEYVTNLAKWEAAIKYCRGKGWNFLIFSKGKKKNDIVLERGILALLFNYEKREKSLVLENIKYLRLKKFKLVRT